MDILDIMSILKTARDTKADIRVTFTENNGYASFDTGSVTYPFTETDEGDEMDCNLDDPMSIIDFALELLNCADRGAKIELV